MDECELRPGELDLLIGGPSRIGRDGNDGKYGVRVHMIVIEELDSVPAEEA